MSENAISRRQFLRGDLHGTRAVIRPPWAVVDSLFVERCTRCERCVRACPEAILRSGRDGYPLVDFHRGECTFCGECAQVCGDGALDSTRFEPWSVKAVIREKCLPKQGVVCRTCGEQCETGAIRFRHVIGGVSHPELDASACDGCGACYGTCPVGAISLGYERAEFSSKREGLTVGASV